MSIYIQHISDEDHELETVDEFETRKEADAAIKEYRMSDPLGVYYISSRACKEWREASKNS